jgi:hypothetical protein
LVVEIELGSSTNIYLVGIGLMVSNFEMFLLQLANSAPEEKIMDALLG